MEGTLEILEDSGQFLCIFLTFVFPKQEHTFFLKIILEFIIFQFNFIPFLHVVSLVEDRHHSLYRVIGSNHTFSVASEDCKIILDIDNYLLNFLKSQVRQILGGFTLIFHN